MLTPTNEVKVSFRAMEREETQQEDKGLSKLNEEDIKEMLNAVANFYQ